MFTYHSVFCLRVRTLSHEVHLVSLRCIIFVGRSSINIISFSLKESFLLPTNPDETEHEFSIFNYLG